MLPDLIKGIRKQSRLPISRAVSIIENDWENGQKLLSELYKNTGNAYRIGITGPPGAGKSSITNNLITQYRSENKKVAVLAVDPTSPFTHGAVLGDRIRMTKHHSDPGVFIRSMASRGGKGGLALRTQEVGDVFDAAGYDIIIYETVGVGQVELDVIQAADTVVVVLVPESGDEIQMLKAGLMEIGNVFAINKTDRPGSNKLKISLENILSIMDMDDLSWMPEVVQTIAIENKGSDMLIDSINKHGDFIREKGLYKIKINERYKNRVSDVVTQNYLKSFWNQNNSLKLKKELEKVHHKRISPYQLANQLVNNE